MNLKKTMFYIKEVGGTYSLYHRLHFFIDTFKTEEKLVAYLERWLTLSPEELWRKLSKEYRVLFNYESMDHFEKDKSDAEHWMLHAWNVGTVTFYEKYPHLIIPFSESQIKLLKKAKAKQDVVSKEEVTTSGENFSEEVKKQVGHEYKEDEKNTQIEKDVKISEYRVDDLLFEQLVTNEKS